MGLRGIELRGMRGAVLATSLACAVAVAVAILVPPTEPRASFRLSAVHVALDTAASLIALPAAFLVAGRFRRRTLLNELTLVSALTVLALSDLFFWTLPMLGGPEITELTAWASLAGSMLGALFFALAAYLPAARVRSAGLGLVAGATAALAFAAVLVASFTADAGRRIAAGALPPGLAAHQAPAAPQVVMAMLYGLAAVGFLARSERLDDEFPGWLAMAAVLAAAARIDYSRYPALDSASAYIGDVFRLLFYGILLAGSMREMWSYWKAAVIEERRRMARDLHDGVAQELAYLARNLDLLAGKANAETVERLRRAIERAQAESRRAIHALTTPAAAQTVKTQTVKTQTVEKQTVETMVAEAASQIAERFNLELAFDSVPGVRLSEPRAEALVRIACEALTNAAKHSGSTLVRLTMTQDGQRVRLCVSDAGCGFDPDAASAGFGLIALRERARSVGGEVRITSAPGGGSEVEAVL